MLTSYAGSMISQQSTAWVRPGAGARGVHADIAIAITLAVASPILGLLYLRTGLFDEGTVAAPWIWAVGIGLTTLPLALRRRYPIPVAIMVSAGFFVCGEFGVPDALIVQIAMFLALYTVGAWGRSRAAALYARIGITGAMLVWVVIDLIATSADVDVFPGMPRTGIFSAFATFAVIQIITNLLYFGAAIHFGERAWRAARTQALLEAQGRELELERQTSAAQAVALDRVAIARELHDVVAHHVSVMGIQAAAARRSLDRDPAQAEASLEIVETSAHAAIEELHRLVRTLRTPDHEGSSSTVGIAQLPSLIAASGQGGVPATLIVIGTPRPLPLLIDVACYRVAQEALTNVRKHAGPGAQATVRLRFDAAAFEVEVADDGVQRRLRSANTEDIGTPAGSGLGLRGIRERIGAVGGEVWSGAREHGGFIVRARVPVAAAAVAAHAFIPQTSSASSHGSTPAMTASNETSPA